MVVLRNRSLSTTATRSSAPPARAAGRKSTRVNISKQDGSDDEILECIVVRLVKLIIYPPIVPVLVRLAFEHFSIVPELLAAITVS